MTPKVAGAGTVAMMNTVPVSFVGLDRLPTGEPRSVVSALHELGSALHALGSPEHHDDADRVRDAMSADLTAETERWSWTTSAIRSQVFLEPPDRDDDIDAVSVLDRHEPAAVANALLRPLTRLGSARSVLGWAASRGPAVRETVELLVTDPAAGARRFDAFLRASWDAWYAEEWRRVRPLLLERARRFRDSVATVGAARALAGLDPSFRLGRDPGTVVLAKVQNTRHDVVRRGLRVAPTVFGAPHVYVANVSRQPVLILAPVTVRERLDVPSASELRQRLTALANPARLEVARAIAGEARTAGEIASLWRMDATAVTRHLRALSAAGLATTERHGRFVRYRLDAEAVRSLGSAVLDLLQR